MKVYVVELPKSCERCPFRDTKYGRCDISGARVDYFGCHSLAPLSEHDKQVRKQVCENFKKRFLATCQIEQGCDNATFSLEILNRILEQIQGENNVKD